MSVAEDYDGIFDTTYHLKQRAETVRNAMDEVYKQGMSKKAYNVAVESHPDAANVFNYRKLTEQPSPSEQKVALEFFDTLISYLPVVSVKEENQIITVTGVPTAVLEGLIYKEWKTSRIFKNMFTRMAARYFQFHSFFAVEIIYMLQKLLENKSAPVRYRGTINSIIKGIEENTWLGEAANATPREMNWKRLDNFTVAPLTKQMEFLQEYGRYVSRGNLTGLMLYSDAGTGKTLSGYFWNAINEFDTLIVVSPKNAVEEVWVKTIDHYFKEKPKYFDSLSSTELKGDEEVVIVHYEYLGKLLAQISKLKGRRVGVWLDESHNLNELKSLRTETFNKICNEVNAEGVVWASGTPLKAIGKETVPLFRSIVPNFTPAVEESFIKIFGASKGFALDILNNRMEMSMFRIRKDDVVINDVEEITIPIKVPDADKFTLPKVAEEVRNYVAERLLYYRGVMHEYEKSFLSIINRFEAVHGLSKDKNWTRYVSSVKSIHRSFDQRRDKDIIVWCKDYERKFIIPRLSSEDKKEFDRVASVYKYVILTVRGEALGRVLTKRRIECFQAMVHHTDFDTIINTARKKTVIFTSYVKVVDEIAGVLNKFKPLRVYGDTNNELTAMLRKFKTDPKANPIIATYNSLSTAVPIVEASTAVLFNSPFRQYIRDQAVARLDRYGQDGPVLILLPILDTGGVKNLSSRSLDIQKYYSEMVDAILGLDGEPVKEAA